MTEVDLLRRRRGGQPKDSHDHTDDGGTRIGTCAGIRVMLFFRSIRAFSPPVIMKSTRQPNYLSTSRTTVTAIRQTVGSVQSVASPPGFAA